MLPRVVEESWEMKVWVEQVCFGFVSDVFAKLHIYFLIHKQLTLKMTEPILSYGTPQAQFSLIKFQFPIVK